MKFVFAIAALLLSGAVHAGHAVSLTNGYVSTCTPSFCIEARVGEQYRAYSPPPQFQRHPDHYRHDDRHYNRHEPRVDYLPGSRPGYYPPPNRRRGEHHR